MVAVGLCKHPTPSSNGSDRCPCHRAIDTPEATGSRRPVSFPTSPTGRHGFPCAVEGSHTLQEVVWARERPMPGAHLRRTPVPQG